jgi:hypothetical protein
MNSKDSKIQISSDKNIMPYSNQLVKRGLDLLSKIQQRIIRVPQDFSSIEEAIEKASEGDTIEISDGTYFVSLYINKALTLKGKTRDGVTLRPKENYIATIESPIGTINFANITLNGKVDQLINSRPNPECIILLAGDINFSNCVFENFEQSYEYWDYLDEQKMDDEYEPCNCIVVKSSKSKINLNHCEFSKSCEVGIWFESDDNIAILDNNIFNTQIILGNNCRATSQHNYFNSDSYLGMGKNSVLLSIYDTFRSGVLLSSSSKCLANFEHATIVVGSLFGHAISRELINPDANPIWTQGKPEVNITNSIVIVKERGGEIRYAPSAQSIRKDLSYPLDPINEGLVDFSGNNLIQLPEHFSSPNPKLIILTNEIRLEPDSPAVKSASDGLNIGAWQLP